MNFILGTEILGNSGTYIYNNGSCIDSLILIINNTSSSSTTISACDSFSWNGYTYLYQALAWVGTNSVGCDSIATLNFVINNTSSSSTTISACDSYDWNSNTYTASGTYTWTVLMLMVVTV